MVIYRILLERKKVIKTTLGLYLDTSVISAVFDNRNPQRKCLTESFFEEISRYQIYISNITITEIRNTPDLNLKERMSDKITGFPVIELSREDGKLADEIIQKGAISKTIWQMLIILRSR